MSLKLFLFWVLLGFSTLSVSCAHAASRLIDGAHLGEVPLASLVAQVQAGDTLILGENHASAPCQIEQMDILRALRQKGLKISVGMEFLEYPTQDLTDQYRRGFLSEEAFLAAIHWGKGMPFAFYRDQISFPNLAEGTLTLALNAPRALTSKVAQKGLDSLDATERALLPPNLVRGNDRYFERFKDSVGHLPNPDAAERYFWAQSIWDDTMAWQAAGFLHDHPEQVLVIIVGEFHVQYGGGLPARLRARSPGRVWTLSQVNTEGMTEPEIQQALGPSPTDGARADWLWVFEQKL